MAVGDFEPAQMQDLGDLIPALLEIKAKAGLPMIFRVRLEVGDGKTRPTESAAKDINAVIKDLDEGFMLH